MNKPWPAWPLWLLALVLVISAGAILFVRFSPKESDYDRALKTDQVVELGQIKIVVPQGVTCKPQKHRLFIRDKDQTGAKPGEVKGKEIEFTRLYVECAEPVILFVENPTDQEIILTLVEQIPQPVKELTKEEQKQWEAAKAEWDKQELLRAAFRKAFHGIDQAPLPYPTYLNIQAVLQKEQGDFVLPPRKVETVELKHSDPNSLKQIVLKLSRS